MRQKLLGILAFVMGLISHNNVFADINKLELQDISIESGSTEVVLPVLLTNENEISGFQCDLYLPEGVEVAKDGDDDFIIDVARTTVKRHSVNARLLPDGVFRIVCSSMKNSTFSGNSGIVLNITLKVKVDKSAGTYDMALKNVVLTGPAAERYTSDDVSAKLTINGVSPIIVKAKSCSRTYGDENPTFEYSVEGGTLDGEPEIICGATTTSPVGVYPISIKKGSIKNNNVTLSAGTLTITKAPLTVSVGNYGKKQGEANPEFKLSYNGFKNKETDAVLKTKPTVTTTATESSAPGEYEIVVSGGEADNYSFAYNNGKLTVAEADAIVITAKSYTRVYGDANPTFEYVVEGGILDGEPVISCEAAATSNVGEYSINVSKGTIKNYNVTLVNGTLSIQRAPLTIIAKSYTIKQGETLPSYEAEYNGFKNNETNEVFTKKPSISCSATSSDVLGKFDILVNGAEAENYEISYVKGTLTISEANPVKVTAKNYIRKYGDPNPTFEYTVEGAALVGEPDIECEATVKSPVGNYPIVISKGLVSNYNDSYVNGTLTVTKAPLTVTAKSYTIKQGETLPTFEVEYNGFRNDETNSVLTSQPTITCSASSFSVPGTYDIIVSGAEADNYEISYEKGMLNIEMPNPIVITAAMCTREYGDANPKFYYTVEGGKIEGEPEIICEATATSPIGQYPIKISKGSIKNYNVKLIEGILTITKAPLNVSVDNYDKRRGEANPEFIIKYEGFKNNENEDVLKTKPTVTTDATEESEPGEYDIMINGGEADNYTLSYSKGKLTILDWDPIIISGKTYTREYGESNPVFEYTVESGILNGEPEVICEADAASPVGEYPITIKKGSIQDEDVTFNAGKLIITPAPLTVSVGNYSKKKGESNPEFTINYKGFKNNENEDVLKVKPTVTTTATTSSEPGVYDLVVSGGEAENYNLSYVNGKLSILLPYNNILSLSDINMPLGNTEAILSILLTNETDISGFQCDLYLANGIEVAKNETGDYKIEVLRSNGKHEVLPRQLSDGAFRILCGSLGNEKFSGNSGVVLQLTLNVGSNYAVGKYEIGLRNIILTDPEVNRYTSDDTSSTLSISAPVIITAKNYSREYGEANPTFEYTVDGAKLEGTPEIICEATATSPVGEYPIIIKKGSVTNYNDTYVNGVLTITKAPLTVSVGNYTRKQGEENPEFPISYSGFKNNETEGVLTKKPTATTTATTSSEPGEYDILVSGAEAQNYDISYKNGKLTVVKADAIVITAKSYTREYGESNPTFEYTVDGAKLEGTPEIICEATATSPAGDYPIIIKKGSVTNYNDTYVNGVLTITRAPLTITAGSYTKKQYEPMPEFSVSFEGFKNNETEKVLSKQPVLNCEANEDSAPGEYDIVVSGAEAQNYEMKYVVGKLTVTEPDSYTLTYMVDGKEYKSFTVKYRESITPLEAPEKEGYTFSGWSEIPMSMPAKDVVITGTFTVNSYTLTYKVDGEVYKTLTVEYSIALTPEAPPTKEGYTFSGWSEIPATMPAKDVVITGSFIINSYTITYVLDGETYTTETLEYGAKIVPPVISGLEDYSIWEDVPETMPAKDITIYGKAKELIDSLTPTLYSGNGEVFDLNGKKLSAPQKGLNIIRMSDGTSKKVMIK